MGPEEDESGQHYFADDPTAASAPATVEVVLPDLAFEYATDRGVFAHSRLDTGTALLLRLGPPLPRRGALLDLGCGAGPIALTLARRAPEAAVWAVDVNRRARALCAENARRLGLTNIVVVAPEEVPADQCFDAIWSNPPIRIGKDALHELLQRWLARLADDAHAALVVQKHLGADSLQKWLRSVGHEVERTASKSGYRLLVVGP
ncbi:MAG: methyltransferase [Actinomycetota bacterium]